MKLPSLCSIAPLLACTYGYETFVPDQVPCNGLPTFAAESFNSTVEALFPPDCIAVSVERDATYCVKGPVCSGPSELPPPGARCPKQGDVALDHCHPWLASFTELETCVLPIDAECRAMHTGAWGCVLPPLEGDFPSVESNTTNSTSNTSAVEASSTSILPSNITVNPEDISFSSVSSETPAQDSHPSYLKTNLRLASGSAKHERNAWQQVAPLGATTVAAAVGCAFAAIAVRNAKAKRSTRATQLDQAASM